MSRKAPREFLATVMGEVYTLHFVPSFKHAKHCTGPPRARSGTGS